MLLSLEFRPAPSLIQLYFVSTCNEFNPTERNLSSLDFILFRCCFQSETKFKKKADGTL